MLIGNVRAVANASQTGCAERWSDARGSELAHVHGDAQAGRRGAVRPLVGCPPQVRIVGCVVRANDEIDPSESISHCVQARVQFVRFHFAAHNIVQHLQMADGLRMKRRILRLDAFLGFSKQAHEVRQRQEPVSSEADLNIDRAIGGRLAENVRYASDEQLRVIVERPINAELLVVLIDSLQSPRTPIPQTRCNRAAAGWSGPC